MNHRAIILVLALPLARVDAAADDSTLTLARELAGQGDHAGAALEFRRLALDRGDAAERSGFFWAAGHAYWKSGDLVLADRMLDRADDEQPLPPAGALVRSEVAYAGRAGDEAMFYLEGVLHGAGTPEEKSYAARRLAELRLRAGDIDGARAALEASPLPHADGGQGLDWYAAGRDKTPWVGGVLGIIPGLGYFYAGEYANGFRSIILNAIFIYGMVDTARDDDWGAFSVITFFEFTWYSGSIYEIGRAHV